MGTLNKCERPTGSGGTVARGLLPGNKLGAGNVPVVGKPSKFQASYSPLAWPGLVHSYKCTRPARPWSGCEACAFCEEGSGDVTLLIWPGRGGTGGFRDVVGKSWTQAAVGTWGAWGGESGRGSDRRGWVLCGDQNGLSCRQSSTCSAQSTPDLAGCWPRPSHSGHDQSTAVV